MYTVTPKYLDIHGACIRYTLGRRTVWTWVRKGLLPKPVYFVDAGPARWKVEELDAADAKREGRAA